MDRGVLKEIYSLDAIEAVDGQSYYLHAILEYQDTSYLIYPAEDLNEEDLRESFDTGIRKIIPGVLKQIGVWQPPNERIQNPFNPQMAPMTSWYMLLQHLSENYYVRNVDLLTGVPPMEVDVLLVLSPEQMKQSELLALDQFIMRGGPVVIAAGSYVVSPLQIVPGLNRRRVEDGIHDLIEHYGVKMGGNLILDTQNEPFPIQVQRDVAGVVVMDIEHINYPFFVDIRSTGLNKDNPIASNIPSITMHWASPLYQVSTKSNVEIESFIASSQKSWLRESIDVRPDMENYPEIGFQIEGEQMSRDSAMTINGQFNSYFTENELNFTDANMPDSDIQMFDTSPDGTRVVVFGSGDFINDTFLELSQSMSEERYLSNLQFVQNAIDWAVKDEGLLKLRGRTIYVRLLDPMSDSRQQLWEYMNYGVMIVGLLIIGILWSLKKRAEKPRYNLLTERES
jgi:ABC-2 type transport system permease protein